MPLELPRLKAAGARLVNRAKRDGSLYVTRGSRDHDLAKQLAEAGWLTRVPTRALAQYRLTPAAVAAWGAPHRPCRFSVGDRVWSDLHGENRTVVAVDYRRGEWHVWVPGYCRLDTSIRPAVKS